MIKRTRDFEQALWLTRVQIEEEVGGSWMQEIVRSPMDRHQGGRYHVADYQSRSDVLSMLAKVTCSWSKGVA